jgi:hypothetical protein
MRAMLAAFEQILATLDRLELPYFIGGSVASGNYGFPRMTNDVDIIVDFSAVDIEAFCAQLEPDFYVDCERAKESIETKRPFNAIHRKSIFKFDFFPAQQSAYGKSQMDRRRFAVSAIPALESLEFAVCSAEDSVLSKLVWFRLGGESSDQQWKDILSILEVQASRLDLDYLNEWSTPLGVKGLLEKALNRVRL